MTINGDAFDGNARIMFELGHRCNVKLMQWNIAAANSLAGEANALASLATW
jgi:hypothetical protein